MLYLQYKQQQEQQKERGRTSLVCYHCDEQAVMAYPNNLRCYFCHETWENEQDFIAKRFEFMDFSPSPRGGAEKTPHPPTLDADIELPDKFSVNGTTYFKKKRTYKGKQYWYWFAYEKGVGQKYIGLELPEDVERWAKQIEAGKTLLIDEATRLEYELKAVRAVLAGEALEPHEKETIKHKLAGK